MLNIIKFDFIKKIRFLKLKKSLSKKGYVGSFVIGCLFALAFCPINFITFIGVLIPLALQHNDGIILPFIFAIGTGLPIILSSIILVYFVTKLAKIRDKFEVFDKWLKIIVSIIFIIVGLYLIWGLFK